MLRFDGGEFYPANGQDAQKIPMCEDEHITSTRPNATEHTVGSIADVSQGLARRATVARKNSNPAHLADFRSALAFVLAIIPLYQVRIDFSERAESRQLTGSLGALERTGEHLHKDQALQSGPQTSRVLFPAFRERNVSSAGVLSRDAPGRFSVPGQ